MKKCLESCLNNDRNNLFCLLVVLLMYGLAGCTPAGPPGSKDVIASYDGEELLREEVDYFSPDGLSSEDSARYADQYIEKWIRLMAVKEEADRKVGGLSKDLQFKLRQYEYQLISNEFANWLIREQGDLEVSEAKIQTHYNKFPEKFVSTTSYYQYFYIKAEKRAQYKIVSLMRSKEQEKIDELIEWAKENAVEYRLDSSYVNDPEIDRLSDGFYFGNIRRASKGTVYPYSHTEDGKTYYDYFRLIQTIKPDDQLPLSLCRTRIINSILSQHKKTLIDQAEASLVKRAKDSKKAQIFK